jgi:hypothetical protein
MTDQGYQLKTEVNNLYPFGVIIKISDGVFLKTCWWLINLKGTPVRPLLVISWTHAEIPEMGWIRGGIA